MPNNSFIPSLALLIGLTAGLVGIVWQTAKELPVLDDQRSAMDVAEATEATPIVHVITPAPTIDWARFPVPLEDSVQKYISIVCREDDVPVEIVLAIMGVESGYDDRCRGDNGNSIGLMQVQPIWHLERIERLGISDLQDPYQNARLGIDILRELYATGNSTEWVLMAYNGGHVYATQNMQNGVISEYAQSVIRLAEELLESAQVVTD